LASEDKGNEHVGTPKSGKGKTGGLFEGIERRRDLGKPSLRRRRVRLRKGRRIRILHPRSRGNQQEEKGGGVSKGGVKERKESIGARVKGKRDKTRLIRSKGRKKRKPKQEKTPWEIRLDYLAVERGKNCVGAEGEVAQYTKEGA